MTAGIVCEYNPLHKGHLYHIEKTKRAGADKIVCVMSGNFVQRGECACIDKWKRAEAAVRAGANLVIDLPVPWAMASAESFARGSVSLLSHFGIDLLSFGSETDDKELLLLCAKITEDEDILKNLKVYMSQGDNYPVSLTKAVAEKFGDDAAKIISSPNSTLAVEYIKQLKKYIPSCGILPVKRIAAEHDSESVTDGFASASKIRELLSTIEFEQFVPDYMGRMLKLGIVYGSAACKTEYAERAILSCLRQMKKEEYSLYVTDESGLSDRIYNSVKMATSLNDLYSFSKSKNYTHSRVRREVMNLYLNVPKEYHKALPPYVKILACDSVGLSLIKNISSDIPVITKHSDTKKLDTFGQEIYSLQCSSTDKFALMSQLVMPCGQEQKNSMIIVK